MDGILSSLVAEEKFNSVLVNVYSGSPVRDRLVNSEASFKLLISDLSNASMVVAKSCLFSSSWENLNIRSFNFSDVKHEICYRSTNDSTPHFIYSSNLPNLPKILKTVLSDNYTCVNGVCLPASMTNVLGDKLPPTSMKYRSFAKKITELGMYAFIIASGAYGLCYESYINPNHAPNEVLDTIKKKYNLDKPFDHYNYSLFSSGIGKDSMGFFFGFVLFYPDWQKTAGDVERIKKHFRDWPSIRKYQTWFSTYFDLETLDITVYDDVIYGKMYQRSEMPSDFWYAELAVRSPCF